jgi:hypothetical protein
MNENRTVIYRKGRVAGTFSVRDGAVELELGALLKKKVGATERFVKEAIQVVETFVDEELTGDP